MQIRIRNLVNPGSGIRDGKMRFGILDKHLRSATLTEYLQIPPIIAETNYGSEAPELNCIMNFTLDINHHLFLYKLVQILGRHPLFCGFISVPRRLFIPALQ
jgi:hypothetical protein